MMCGGVFNDHFIARLLLSPTVKEFWKSVNVPVWQSYGQEYGVLFLTHGVLIWTIDVYLYGPSSYYLYAKAVHFFPRISILS